MFEFKMGTSKLNGVLDKAGKLHWEAYSVAHMLKYKSVYQFTRNKHTFPMNMAQGKDVRVITHARLMLLLKKSKTHREIYNYFNNGLAFVKITATTPVRCIQQCSEDEPNAKLFQTWLNEMRAELAPPRVLLKRKASSPPIRCTLFKRPCPDSPPLPQYPFALPNHVPKSPPYPPPPSPVYPPQSSPRYTPASPTQSSPRYTPASPCYVPPSCVPASPPQNSPRYTPASPCYVPPRCVPASPSHVQPPASPCHVPQQDDDSSCYAPQQDDDSSCYIPHRDSPPARRCTSPPPPRNCTPMARRCTSPARRYTSPPPPSRRYLAPSPYSPSRPECAPAPSTAPALGLSMWMDSVPPTKIFIFTGSRVQTFVPQ